MNQAALRARLAAVSPRVWLVVIVVVSAVVRIGLARRMVAPWIMVDELVYSELAKSVADQGQFLVRGVPSSGYGIVYPLLIAPAWRLYAAIPDAYAAAKVINGVVMSLAAVPAYALARRVLTARAALAVAALTIIVPSMLYTGTLMTENAFYPVFLAACLAIVWMLEQPSVRSQALALLVCGFAYFTRAQAIALLAALVTAPLLLALTERDGKRWALRSFAPLYGVVGGGGLLVLLVEVARGKSPLDLLGAYRAATTSTYTVSGVAHYLLYHWGELSLYVGIVPFAALAALWLSPQTGSRSVRAFSMASFAVVFWLLLEVATFASQTSVSRIEERNMFYVAPLFLIALVGVVNGALVPRTRRTLWLAAAGAAVLPAFVPYDRLITTTAVSDTFALLPWWWLQDHGIALADVRWAVLGVAIAAAVALLGLPRRFLAVLPVLVGCYFVATAFVVENGRHGIHLSSLGSLWAGIHNADPNWIDRTVGKDATVSYLWTGKPTVYAIWENEFFNRSFGPVYDLTGPSPGSLPETPVTRGADGVLRADAGPVSASYVLADGSVDILGHEVGSDPGIGVRLYRVDGPIVVLTHVTGIYDGDTWSGARVTYTRVHCTGGTLRVALSSDPSLFDRDQIVTATVGAAVVGRATVTPTEQSTLDVPLTAVRGRCVARFAMAHTLVPATVIRGNSDTRPLGVHFDSFAFTP